MGLHIELVNGSAIADVAIAWKILHFNWGIPPLVD
jgi:hypothetical protein